MTTLDTPDVAWRGGTDADGPLVVLLHGRGSNENDVIALADHRRGRPRRHGLTATTVEPPPPLAPGTGASAGDVMTASRPFEIGLFTFGAITADPVTGRPIDPAVRLRRVIDLSKLADEGSGRSR